MYRRKNDIKEWREHLDKCVTRRRCREERRGKEKENGKAKTSLREREKGIKNRSQKKKRSSEISVVSRYLRNLRKGSYLL